MSNGSQLIKKQGTGYSDVFPITYMDLVRDRDGHSLKDLLQNFNNYYVLWRGNKADTRRQIPTAIRRLGLFITYVSSNNNTVIEYYDGMLLDDVSWGDNENWRMASNSLVGEISISTDGTWIIDGRDTKQKALGDPGETPILAIRNNKLCGSYNKGKDWELLSVDPVLTKIKLEDNRIKLSTDLGETWEESDQIAAYFRWNSSIEDPDYVGVILISRDGETWEDLSPYFTNHLRVKDCLNSISDLNSLYNAKIGDMYCVPKLPFDSQNPQYDLYVKSNDGWTNCGGFSSITVGLTSTPGDSPYIAASLACVSNAINLKFKVVSQLPDTPESDVFYFVYEE